MTTSHSFGGVAADNAVSLQQSARRERVAAAIGRAQPRMRDRYGANCCIIATRIAVEVFRENGIKAVPTPVSVDIFPDGETARYRLGFAGAVLAPGHWDGHLVCVADRAFMLDLTIDQINTRLPSAALRPLWGPAPADFARGGEVRTRVGSCGLHYVAHPGERAFLCLEDWEDEPERRPIIELIREDLANGSAPVIPSETGRRIDSDGDRP